MGIAGSAWGTNAAVMLELLVMGIYLARPAMIKMFGTGDVQVRWPLMRNFLRVGAPSGFQFTCDIGAWSVFTVIIVASYGTPVLSANIFAFTYMHLCFMPAFGVGGAVTALVGKYIGMGRPELGERRAHLGFFICATYMVAVGILLFVFRRPLIGLFSGDAEVIRVGGIIMTFVAIYQIFDAMFLVYAGALRGAGDTLVPAIIQAALVWSIVVGGGSLCARYAPQFGIVGPWTLASIFGAILGLFLLFRFRRGVWKQIDLQVGSNVAEDSAKLSVANETTP
jgi:Na+-driven multidrug efflux pump